MGSGTTAKKLNSRSYRRHPFKDSSVWEVVTGSMTTASTVLKQGVANTTKEQFYPTVHEINEHEAANLGANIRSGDLRLGVDGFVHDFTLKTPILCDGDPVDVKRVKKRKHLGEVVGYNIYVERRDRKEA